jgi:ABC-type transporter Mla MlaB component
MASSSNDGGEGVLKRMVKMVSPPGRDSSMLGGDPGGSQFAEAEKAELKAMIERKRRNDFVRKRELNMLRRIRREGLSPDQAAALDASSRLDDSEVRATQPPGTSDLGVKAKIDAIEQQMVGGGAVPSPLRTATAPKTRTGLLAAVSRKVGLAPRDDRPTVPAGLVTDAFDDVTRPMMMLPAEAPRTPVGPAPALPQAPQRPTASTGPLPELTQPVPDLGLAVPAAASLGEPMPAPASPLPSVEVTELAHDHELDEAVIAFANADFNHCERALVTLVGAQGLRFDHEDTWLALFDLYRATGQQQRFESLSLEFGQHFQKSTPQWYSLPKLVAEAASSGQARYSLTGHVGWVCPATLDAEGVIGLVSQTLQLPQPWVLDWTALSRIDPDAVNQLHTLLRQWAGQPLEMRWLASDRLFSVLQDSAPVGVRDADPGFWLARLQALRLINRPDQFDEVAIDYCVTYEVSPPSWEPTKGVARVAGSASNTRSATLSVVGDAITTVQGGMGDTQGVAITTLDLSGQLSGDISPVLSALDSKLGGAQIVRISCALLIRVDFIAAGDLLNWIIARQGEGRHISFIDVHRLVALMFGAMGITEHAPVHLRQA